MEKNKILIVEDDPFLGLIVKECFDTRGFEAHLYNDGAKGYQAFCDLEPDICILDVMMPVKDGFTLAEEIRTVDKEIPILFLTAKSMVDDVLKGFNAGADDYVKKPFSMEELIVRVKALLKRKRKEHLAVSQSTEYQIGKYHFNYDRLALTCDGKKQKLTPREAELLKLLCDNMNQVLDRNLALKKIWGDDSFFNGRSMDVFITKIRKYLKQDPDVELINVRGKGYKLLFLQ